MLFVYIAAFLLILMLLISCGCYRYIFYSPERREPDDYSLSDLTQSEDEKERCIGLIRKLNEREYERVYTKSFDGLRLTGRYYRIYDEGPLVIMFHGYTGTPSRDFCGGADICFSSGYSALLVEERAHCKSEGHTVTFGVKERRDVHSWIGFALENYGKDKDIVLVGISMGAATVLMASGLGLPKSVKGIIADCPYGYAEKVIEHAGRERKLPMGLLLPFIKLGALLFGGFRLSEGNAVSAAGNASVPIMIIHGEADTLVPCAMSEEIAAANPKHISRYTFPGGTHGTSYLKDTERYTALVKDFYKKVLS